MSGRYGEPIRLDDVQISALYNGNDLAQRIICTKPKEMFRRGWVLVVKTNDATDNGANAAAQVPTGGESGPAAPGAPLVDPMSGSAAPAMAPPAPGANITDPMGEGPSRPIAAPSPGPVTPAQANKPAPVADQNANADLAVQAEAYASRLALIPRAQEASIFGRAFGGGLMIVGADDGQDMSTPLREDNISTIRYLSWIDRRFVFASTWYATIGPKYGEVETWEIINPFGGQANTRVHETRVVRFDGMPVDFLMRRRLLGWTLSVLQAPYDILRQFDQSFQGLSNLMADMSQAVMKINGLAQLISNDQATLQTRMQMVDMSRSTARMLYIDAENEEFTRQPTPLTGVGEAIQMQMLRVSAAAEMPVSRLFGRQPSGLNATGDADIRQWYDQIAGDQKQVLEPKLLRLYSLIFAAKDGPTGGRVPDLSFVWHKLYEMSELEQSTIRFNMAQADDLYIGNGTLLPSEVAMSRFRNGDLHLDTEIDMDEREKQPTELAPQGNDAIEKQHDQAVKLAAAKPAAPVAGKGPPPARGDAAGERWDSSHNLADAIYSQLLDDYSPEACMWVKSATWKGPVRVPVDRMNFSEQHKWAANNDPVKIQAHAQRIKAGTEKPIILCKVPNSKKLEIIDGHHRALAYQKLGQNARAYVAKVDAASGPWCTMHGKQKEGLLYSDQKQTPDAS
jgi:phage-related protein (TIGR01555 family)